MVNKSENMLRVHFNFEHHENILGCRKPDRKRGEDVKLGEGLFERQGETLGCGRSYVILELKSQETRYSSMLA